MPLATQLRPKTLKEFIGQSHLVGPDGPIRKLLDAQVLSSMIFWGPPASGKTSLAEIIAQTAGYTFYKLSAVTDGKDALKRIITSTSATGSLNPESKKVLLFIDEIHRWSKLQQDALLPYVESGQITLIGATTENPSFTVISPLLSRSRVFIFHNHTVEDISKSLKKGEKLLDIKLTLEVRTYLAQLSNGDMRFALNTLELAHTMSKGSITKKEIEASAQKFLRYDKNGEEHYNIISAVHKSLRSSNATAAVYWIMRMLEAGDDPLYVARRLIRFASEDIGNSNPNALLLANVVYDTCQKIGVPECNTALVQLAQYLADSAKSNATYVAVKKAQADIKKYGNQPVPLHLRNAPTELMKEIGYGKGYEYDPDLKNKKSDQQCMPDNLIDRSYF